MQIYRTKNEDVLDGVVHAAYGQCTDSMLRAVLEANPGLAGCGAVLPAGIEVFLPDNVQENDRGSLANQGVSLWD